MNSKNTRGTPRPTLSPRYGDARPRQIAENMPVAGIIPVGELRRLVAAMVD